MIHSFISMEKCCAGHGPHVTLLVDVKVHCFSSLFVGELVSLQSIDINMHQTVYRTLDRRVNKTRTTDGKTKKPDDSPEKPTDRYIAGEDSSSIRVLPGPKW